MSQLLSLREYEMDQLASFLCHDIRIHKEYYRLADATKVAKLSKLLILMENGGAGMFPEKDLDDLDFNVECTWW